MKFDWSNYLALAENLLDEVTSSSDQVKNSSDSASNELLREAKLRCAISRAYYSAFCVARNYLRDVEEDYELKKSKEYGIRPHQHVIKSFKNSSDKIYRNIGLSLERLIEMRHEADYEDILFSNTILPKAQRSVKLAREIIDQLRRLEQDNQS